MARSQKERVLVVLSLSGGNDFLNTMIPYTNPLYQDYRPTLGIPLDTVLPLNNELGWGIPTGRSLKAFMTTAR